MLGGGMIAGTRRAMIRGMVLIGTPDMIGGRMDICPGGVAISRSAIQPGTVMKPRVRSIIDTFAAAHITTIGDASAESKFNGGQKHRTKKKFADGFHGRVAGLALSTYSTSPIMPPVGSAMMANRLS